MKAHNEFMAEVKEITREKTVAEQTEDALKEEVKEWIRNKREE